MVRRITSLQKWLLEETTTWRGDGWSWEGELTLTREEARKLLEDYKQQIIANPAVYNESDWNNKVAELMKHYQGSAIAPPKPANVGLSSGIMTNTNTTNYPNTPLPTLTINSPTWPPPLQNIQIMPPPPQWGKVDLIDQSEELNECQIALKELLDQAMAYMPDGKHKHKFKPGRLTEVCKRAAEVLGVDLDEDTDEGA